MYQVLSALPYEYTSVVLSALPASDSEPRARSCFAKHPVKHDPRNSTINNRKLTNTHAIDNSTLVLAATTIEVIRRNNETPKLQLEN